MKRTQKPVRCWMYWWTNLRGGMQNKRFMLSQVDPRGTFSQPPDVIVRGHFVPDEPKTKARKR